MNKYFKNLGHIACVCDDAKNLFAEYGKLDIRPVFTTKYGELFEVLKKAFGGTVTEKQNARLAELSGKYNQVWNTYFKISDGNFIEFFNAEKNLLKRDCENYVGLLHTVIEVEDISVLADILKAVVSVNAYGSKYINYIDSLNSSYIIIEYSEKERMALGIDVVCGKRLSQIVLRSVNYSGMISFFCNMLMLDIVTDRSGEALFKVCDNRFIRVIEDKAAQRYDCEAYYGFRHICIEVDKIEELYEKLKCNGLIPDSNIRRGIDGSYQFWISDPDGNKYELMCYTAQSKQIVFG